MARPNILYIHTHDTGRYVQPYGYAIDTPNIQKLAETGVLFRKCFCAGPTCSPSRAALLTGMNPHSAGMIGLAHRGFSLKDYSQHIIHTLKAAGYHTVLVGMQHVAEKSETIGYDEQFGDAANPQIAAMEFLRHKPAQPFFLSVGFSQTHRTGRIDGLSHHTGAGGTGEPRYTLPPAPLPDTPQTRADFADFKTAAADMDRKMGEVFDVLDETGLAESTLVICTTDHGIAFPGMKCNLTDHGIGVMLILRGPGGFGGGKVVDAMVSHLDLFPTLCDLGGIEKPAWLEGESLLPLVHGETDEIHGEIFAEVTYHAAYEPMRCVRTPRYKYIRRFGDRRTPVLPNCDDSCSKNLWMDAGWRERTLAREELYDLIFDPQEANNVAFCEVYADVRQQMRRRLNAWMHRTHDPLLGKGEVPAPRGAKVSRSDAVSPGEPPIIVE